MLCCLNADTYQVMVDFLRREEAASRNLAAAPPTTTVRRRTPPKESIHYRDARFRGSDNSAISFVGRLEARACGW